MTVKGLPCALPARAAYAARKPPNISELVRPFSGKSDQRQFGWDGAWFTTSLTSTLGSMSISVEGGP